MPTADRQLSYDIDALFQGNDLGGGDLGQAPSSQSTYYDGLGAGAIVDGNLVANFQQIDGAIFSGKTSFNNTETGYRLGLDSGTAKFYIGNSSNYLNWTGSALNISGAITATTGTIGGWTIGSDYIRDTAGVVGLSSAVTGGDDIRFWAGNATPASAAFKVTEAGAVTASSITITGGSIAGTPISSIPNNSSTDISLLDYTHNIVFSVTDKDTVAWASGTITLSNGRTFSISSGNTGNMAAKTYVYLDTGVSSTVLQTTTTVATAMGANKKLIAWAQNGSAQPTFTVYNGIGGIRLDSSSVSISNNNWTYTGAWSVTDADTIAWASGTLKTSDGTSYSITGSNTGNMAAKTYIYFDLGTSSTAFQTTTTATTAIGEGKILIAIAQNGTAEANFIVVNDKAFNIDAANIVAGSITANEIAASTITAGKLSVSQLSAIAADMGSLTTGTIGLDSGTSYIKSGATAYNSGTGFWLERNGGTPRFFIGNSAGNKLTWDGSSLAITGSITATTGTIGGWTINSTSIYTGTEDHTGYTTNAGDITIYSNGADASIHAKNFYIDTSGNIAAQGGTIATWSLSSTQMVSSNSKIKLDANTEVIYVGAATDILTGDGIYLGLDGDSQYDFRVGNPAATYMHWDGSAGTLNIVGGSLNVGTTGNVRGGSTDYLTGTGFFLGYSGAAHKFSVGNPSGNYIAWDGSAFVVNGFALTTKGFFGGDGSDGALSITSGTTTIDLGNAATVTKNYTSISITSTGKLAFSNPHANGTTIILKSQGNVTITSTATCIDASALGAAGGTAVSISSNTSQNGNNGSTGVSDSWYITNYGAAGVPNDAGEVSGGAIASFSALKVTASMGKYSNIIPGAGGGSGGVLRSGGSTTITSGAGGRGGGALIIECGGAWNFTTASGISVAGAAGGNGTVNGAAAGSNSAGGGGGGGGGIFIGLYKTLTANSGSVVVTAASGGSGAQFGTDPDGGGGGGASVETAGSNSSGGTGGAGGAGKSVIAQNTLFA